MGVDCLLLYGNNTFPILQKPAGVFRLATELRCSGFDTLCVDIGPLTVKHSSVFDKIVDHFVGANTLWVGISVTFLSHVLGVEITPILSKDGLVENKRHKNDELLLHFIDACKKKNPSIKFIIGGGIFFNLHQYGFYHFRGNADVEIVEFTKWCKNSLYSPKIQRLGKIITGKEFKEFSSAKIIWHKNDLVTPTDVLPIEISRGCIFRCKFCSFPMNGKTKGEWIKRSEVLLEEMISNFEQFGTTQYLFSDDTYNDSIEKISSLHDTVFSQLPFQLDFTTYLRFDLITRFPETADILKKSGLKSAMFGLETNNKDSAKAIGKGMDFDRQIDFMKRLKSSSWDDILMASGFILGLPYDTPESWDQLQNFLLSADNPLDHWVVKPLRINAVDKTFHHSYFSEFDLQVEKYGYTVFNNLEPDGIYRMKWSHKSGMTFDSANDKSVEIENASKDKDSFKFGSWFYPRLSAIISEKEQIRKLSQAQLKRKYDINLLAKQYIADYYNRLFRL